MGKLLVADVQERDEHVEIFLTFPILDAKSNPIKKKEKIKKVGFGSTVYEEEKPQKSKEKTYQIPVNILL